MEKEKLSKANELNKKINNLEQEIKYLELMFNDGSLSCRTNHYSCKIYGENSKQIILNLAKSLMETDLKKLQTEFDEL